MTLLADKLQQAGYDTFEARFAKLAFDALRMHPESVVDAWREIGVSFGYAYLRERMQDMQPNVPAKEPRSPPAPFSPRVPTLISKPYKPRPQMDAAKVATAKSQVVEILFGYKVSDGRDLADVGAHELDHFERDGRLVVEIKKELPVLTGNMRFANLRDLLTAEQVKAALARAGL